MASKSSTSGRLETNGAIFIKMSQAWFYGPYPGPYYGPSTGPRETDRGTNEGLQMSAPSGKKLKTSGYGVLGEDVAKQIGSSVEVTNP